MLSIFGAMTFLATDTVNAGVYGAYTELPAKGELPKPVAAGVEGLIPQLVIATSALSGISITTFLIKKTK